MPIIMGRSSNEFACLMTKMFRTALRNVGLMLCLALPLFVVASLLMGWLGTTGKGPDGVSFTDVFAGLLFMYSIWALPATALAATHQFVLAAIRPDWSARKTRLVIVATTLGMAALLCADVWRETTPERAFALAAALLPPAIAYGLLARPLR